MVDPVRAAVDDFDPDVIVADQQAFAGAVVAVERGCPWATAASTPADLVGPVPRVPRVALRFERQIEALCERLDLLGLAAAGFDPRHSPQLRLQYTTSELMGRVARALPSLAFVGPSPPAGPDDVAF